MHLLFPVRHYWQACLIYARCRLILHGLPLFYAVCPLVWGALKGLVTEFDIKADVLVSIALIASLTIGEDFAAGEIAFIMQLGSLLEEATVARARQVLKNWCAFLRVLRAGLLTAKKKLSVLKMYGRTIFCVCCRAKPSLQTV